MASPTRRIRRTLTPSNVTPSTPTSISPTVTANSLPSSPLTQFTYSSPTILSAATSRSPTPTHTGTAASPTTSLISATAPAPSRSNSHHGSSTQSSAGAELTTAPKAPKPAFFPSSSVTLTQFNTLVYYEITSRLALLALLPTHVWETRRGLVEYNVVFFREGVQEIYDVEQDARRRVPRPAQS